MQHDKMSVLSSLLPVVVKPGSLGSTTSLPRSVEFVKLSCSWYSIHGLELVWGVYWPLYLRKIIVTSYSCVTCDISTSERSMYAGCRNVGTESVTIKMNCRACKCKGGVDIEKTVLSCQCILLQPAKPSTKHGQCALSMTCTAPFIDSSILGRTRGT
jgi:hypothetical protein